MMMSYLLWSTNREWIDAGVLLDQEVVWLEPPTLKFPEYKKIDLEKMFNLITNEHFQSVLEHKQLLEWLEFYRSL